ncbi:MAG: alpha/beta hydrolase family protein [Oscillospiraceae bacterium]|nr:alpha/beta hydrolase family protein [Oscillospiraceae bacterium]
MAYYIDSYMESLYKGNKIKFNIDDIKNYRDFQDFYSGMYEAYISCLGEIPADLPLDVKILSENQRGGYKILKIEYTLDENLRAPAYVLIPDGAKSLNPGAVALAGHGYGVADIVGIKENGEERLPEEDPGYHKNFAVELVKKGFIVAAPELLGFGELVLAPNTNFRNEGSSCYPVSTQLLMYKKTMAGLRVKQAVRMLDYLAGRDDVDSGRIGSMGISGGGLVSSFFAALDKRVKACVVSGYLCTFKQSIMGVQHCVDNFIPGLLKYGEMADLFGLIAPRPLLIESGESDDIFPIDGVKSSYARLEALYKKLDAPDKIDADIFDGGHQIWGVKSYDFLVKWL